MSRENRKHYEIPVQCLDFKIACKDLRFLLKEIVKIVPSDEQRIFRKNEGMEIIPWN